MSRFIYAVVAVTFTLLLFIFITSLFAEDRMIYIINRPATPDLQIDALENFGYKKHGQPVFITERFHPGNTNYVKIALTPTTGAEKTALQNLVVLGKIKPLQKVTIKGAYDSRIGGNISWVEIEDCTTDPGKYICLPSDWNRDWSEVEISSP